MTYKEKLIETFPSLDNILLHSCYKGGVLGCPSDYFDFRYKIPHCNKIPINHECKQCWDSECNEEIIVDKESIEYKFYSSYLY